ncbi:YqaJ viral recombinase family protein [Qipengyuania thermophila]|uniref:YqaJ viral recombinase family protein n=1 Tax=Qipengyuania thermophila TaxID=2509361 RepID=UPI0013ED1826|nr:YqaJ viral recombinase family protein [Qipengyuania thermophila]
MSLLDTLGLSPKAVAERHAWIGGSDANTIMSGDEARILSLWRQKRGEEGPDDLSASLAVQMGSYTEPLNRAWYELQTGNLVHGHGKVAVHATIPYMRATLDGVVFDPLTDAAVAVFEAKHTGTYGPDADLFARYVPQLTHNCLCAGHDQAVLSVFRGNADWVMFEYALDADYAAALLEAEERFWACVRSGEPPVPLPPPPPPKPKGVREYDMTGSNAWAAQAGEYLDTLLAAERHAAAKAEIKRLVPDDASLCTGHGLTVKRDKRGALRFAVEGE